MGLAGRQAIHKGTYGSTLMLVIKNMAIPTRNQGRGSVSNDDKPVFNEDS